MVPRGEMQYVKMVVAERKGKNICPPSGVGLWCGRREGTRVNSSEREHRNSVIVGKMENEKESLGCPHTYATEHRVKYGVEKCYSAVLP